MKTWSARNGLVGVFIATALVIGSSAGANSKSIGYERRYVARTYAHVVTVNLKDPQVAVTLVVSRGGIGSAESFPSMVRRARPDAAITGTFFGVKGLMPIGNLVADGRLLYPVATGTTFAITRSNQAVVLATKARQPHDWKPYSAALFAGPTLVKRGRLAVRPWAEGFGDRAHYRPARRTAIGVTARGKLLLVAVARPISLTRMARVMRALGAREAYALDGGTSTAMHYRGSTIVKPGRNLTHIIAVYSRRPQQVALAPVPRS